MTLPYGTVVRSIRGRIYAGAGESYENGTIVGYGVLQWPSSANMNGDGGIPQPVYLVQVSEGSTFGQMACVVLRADMVIEVL